MSYQQLKIKLLTHGDKVFTHFLTTGEVLTYNQFHQRVINWAHYFSSLGVTAGNRVVIATEKEYLHFIILCALNSIDVTYVPLKHDLSLMEYIKVLDQLKPNFLLADKLIIDNFERHGEILESVNHTGLSPDLINQVARADVEPQTVPIVDKNMHPVYALFSSGSTGAKKTIEIFSGGLNKYWPNIERLLNMNHEDKVLVTRCPSSDARISEYLRAIVNGCQLVFINSIQRKNFTDILDVCEKEKISCILFIPSLFNPSEIEAIIARFSKAGVKHLLVTGEACSLPLKNICEKNHIKLWNCYGPTEATFGLSMIEITGVSVLHEGREIIPIGPSHAAEVIVHIVDGQLCIESPYLGRYIGEGDGSFITREIDGEERYLFNTGDCFSMHENGCLMFNGRAKFEKNFIKVSGKKIFPNAVKMLLNQFNQHKKSSCVQAEVVVKKHLNRDRLFAYLVMNSSFNVDEFFLYLDKSLSKEQLPILVKLDEFPRLDVMPKVDLNALISRKDFPSEFLAYQETVVLESSSGYVHIAEEIKEIWLNVLNLKDVNRDREFWHLGGDSISSMDLAIKINEKFSPFEYRELLMMEKVTINSIVHYLRNRESTYKRMAFIHELAINEASKEKNSVLYILPDLLGNGKLPYMQLADTAIKSFKGTNRVMGLSEPGLFDSSWLPVSVDDMTERYVKAILSDLKEGEQVSLIGFSLGCTLAYLVTQRLESMAIRVIDVHLLDGHSPALYQALDNNQHIALLQILVNQIIDQLKGELYRESSLKHIVIEALGRYSKETQIKKTINFLLNKVKSKQSTFMILVAQSHLMFLLDVEIPVEKLIVQPTLYFSSKHQDYHKIFFTGKIAESEITSKYHGWNLYFNHIILSGINIKLNHMAMISLDVQRHIGDEIIEGKRGYVRQAYEELNITYKVEPIDSAHVKVTLFFVPPDRLNIFKKIFMQASPNINTYSLISTEKKGWGAMLPGSSGILRSRRDSELSTSIILSGIMPELIGFELARKLQNRGCALLSVLSVYSKSISSFRIIQNENIVAWTESAYMLHKILHAAKVNIDAKKSNQTNTLKMSFFDKRRKSYQYEVSCKDDPSYSLQSLVHTPLLLDESITFLAVLSTLECQILGFNDLQAVSIWLAKFLSQLNGVIKENKLTCTETRGFQPA